jgi:hypothetical protein
MSPHRKRDGRYLCVEVFFIGIREAAPRVIQEW